MAGQTTGSADWRRRGPPLPKRVRVSLVWCKGCQEGRIIMALVSADGQALREVKLAEHPVPTTFVCGMLEKPATPGNTAEPDTTPDTGLM